MELSRRKRIAIIIAMVAIFGFICFYYANCTHGFYSVRIKAKCLSNDSVGDEWEKIYKVDGKTINGEMQLIAPLDNQKAKTINVTIIEKDKHPDISSKDIKIIINHKKISKEIITVTENNGRYKGNVAKWEVTISVKRTGRVTGAIRTTP